MTTQAGTPEKDLAIIDQYWTSYPSAQNAVDIFAGDWSSTLPDEAGATTGGFAGLFEDPRIDWMVEQIGGVAGQRVLELGPLEGGHGYRLETAHDAAEIIAIEANQRAYLKSLVAKELLGTTRTTFLLGDFNAYMAQSGERFDLVVACGVLYHMEHPAEHIKLLCSSADTVFVWTHYYDEALVAAAGEGVADRFSDHIETGFEGYGHVLHRQEYRDALGWGGFCGAGRTFAHWLELDDMYALFDRYGFAITATGFEHPDHPHGPALCFIAERRV